MTQVSGVQVRRLRVGDEHHVVMALTALGQPAEELVARTFLADPMVVAVGALWGTEIVGFAYGHVVARPDVAPMARVEALDVLAQYRRQGIGRRIVEAFVDICGPVSQVRAAAAADDAPAQALFAAAGGTPHGLERVHRWHPTAAG